MPQHAWNITGIQGNTFKLGLFHGDDTGHVVVHCNDKVVAIDFSIREAKTYSLFLDEELCEISIDPNTVNSYDYTCRINTEVKTPLNEERKKLRADQSRVENMRFAAAAVVTVLIVLFLVASAM